MKKVAFLTILVIILGSTSTIFAQDNMKAKQPAAVSVQDQSATVITPEKFQEFAANNVGKEVEIKGMVVHVCKEGGKKMFIIGDDPEQRVKITPSDKIGVFKPELEGSTVEIKGIIEPIEEEAVPEEEKKSQDADHSNYYHKPQYAISCLTLRTLED
jgi:hypothetical protein